MLKNKSLLIFVSIILALQFVSASTFKQYDVTDFAIPCVIDDSPCGNTATCQITIQYPNASYLVDNADMSYHAGGLFNYTVLFNTLGTHSTKVSCSQSGLNATSTFKILITTTGLDNNNTLPLFLALGGFILFIIAIFARNLYIGFISGMVFIVLGIYMMIYGLGNISDFYTQTLSYVALGFGLLVFISAGYEAISDTGVRIWKNNDDFDE